MKKAIILLAFLLVPLVSAGKINYTWSVDCDTNSMYPAINCTSGTDIIVTVNTVTPHDNLTVGDIYWYRPDYRNFNLPLFWHVSHRLVKVENGTCYFHGDGLKYPDKPVDCKYVAIHVIDVRGAYKLHV